MRVLEMMGMDALSQRERNDQEAHSKSHIHEVMCGTVFRILIIAILVQQLA